MSVIKLLLSVFVPLQGVCPVAFLYQEFAVSQEFARLQSRWPDSYCPFFDACCDTLHDAVDSPICDKRHVVHAIKDTELLSAVAKDVVVPDKGGKAKLTSLSDECFAIVGHVLMDRSLVSL